MAPTIDDTPGISIVYDGECPFCANYVGLARLRDAVGLVRLIDAREPSPEVDRLRAEGYDLNEGMAMIEGDRIYHGAACLTRMAALSTRSGVFNRLNALVFRSPRVSGALYPFLRAGRNATLRLRGQTPI
ncbi:MAG: DCC1-like thiol-disulfide oxidoreductase family protein [Pseudomonadota bacterium]